MPPARIIPLVKAAAAATTRLDSLPPLSLYIHFPWCVRKCPYCDFNSHEARGEIPESAYLAALVSDLESALPDIWGRRVVSVFIGGGTPSLMSPRGLDSLLGAVRARLMLAPDAEITLEANPGTLDTSRIAEFRAAGANRLSLGVQSFDEAALAAIGRIHGRIDALQAIEAGLRHFDNLNIDLMYGLPGQTLAAAAHDIDTAIAFGTPHISAYQLTLEPNTPFHNRPPALPDGDTASDMQDQLEHRLARAGYARYEVSAFARPGRRCAHNLNYWEFGDYLGIGAGAHGKISFPNRITRETRPRGPRDYLAAEGTRVGSRRDIATDELPFEFMMNAMRLVDGWPRTLYGARTGRSLEDLAPTLRRLQTDGLLTIEAERIAPTPHGLRFLNELLQRFLPDREAG